MTNQQYFDHDMIETIKFGIRKFEIDINPHAGPKSAIDWMVIQAAKKYIELAETSGPQQIGKIALGFRVDERKMKSNELSAIAKEFLKNLYKAPNSPETTS